MDTQLDEKAIFNAARRIADVAARDAYLAEACGSDSPAAQRIRRLLEIDADAPSFLEPPASLSGSTEVWPISEQPGTVIGPYTLVEQIGEGGFGLVFVAEQHQPIRRRVALKVIKPGMDTRQVIARFEAERQALALMDHPNIAKVYDAGATENGRPYFVMELVQGVPITDYCDQCNLTMDERLALFVTVCQAMQHAHQKGVIHRDIKPTNVLVAMQDGKPAPKIIDFGIAKAIDQRLTEQTLTAAFAQIVGTPLYMSPEQAELSPLGVDTRSDIYSLGVLLYELLTGSTPFDKARLHAAAFDEFRRIIREEEPPRPSTRLSTLDAELATTIAEHRRTEVRRLRQSISDELDWIVMKCLEKDRNRRYDSAGSLARDVERFLHDEAVLACPPSYSYRLKKFVRRNKIAAAFVLILLASVAALTVSNIQSRRNERRAVTEGAKAIATSDLLLAMLDSASPDQAKGSEYTVRELLDDFSAGLGDQLKDQPEAEAAVRTTIGNAYRRLELYQKAQIHLEAALRLRRELYGNDHELVADSLVALAWNLFGQRQNEESKRLLADALRIYESHHSNPARMIHVLWYMQVALMQQRGEEAAECAKRALAIAAQRPEVEYPEVANVLHSLAQVRIREGRYPEAEALARRSVEMHRRLHGSQHPETAFALQKLGIALENQQRPQEAKIALEEALQIFRKHYKPQNTAVDKCSDDLERVLEACGDTPALAQLSKEKVEQAMHSDSPDYDVHLAGALLSDSPTEAQSEEARALVRRAVQRYGQMAKESPHDIARRLAAADGYIRVAKVYAKGPGFARELDESFRTLKAELDSLTSSFPDSLDCSEQVGIRNRKWGFGVVGNAEYLPQAERAFGAAIQQLEKLALDDPKRLSVWYLLANTYTWQGETLWRTGRMEEASVAFQRAIEIYDEHESGYQQNSTPQKKNDIAWDFLRIAAFSAATHHQSQATELVRRVDATLDHKTDPVALANTRYYLALLQLQLGDEAGYRATCKALVEAPVAEHNDLARTRSIWTPSLAPNSLDDPSLPVKRGEEFNKNNRLNQPPFGLYILGAALFRSGQYELAAQRLEESLAVSPGPTQPGFDGNNYQRLFLAMTKWKLGQHDEARKLLAETRPTVDKELQSPAATWNRRATLEILRRQAESLIGTAPTKDGKPAETLAEKPSPP